VLVFEDSLMEPLPLDGLTVPVVRMTTGGLPTAQVQLGDQVYEYERSYPIKGYSAVLPRYLNEQMAAGRKPLLIERPDRFYLYFAT
jgi:hypothetical protein